MEIETPVAVPEAEAPAPAPVEPAKYTVKVDGQERTVSLEELQKGYSHASAANKRMQEAAEIRKTHEELVSVLREAKNPENFLALANALGIDFDEIATKRVLSKLQFEELSPEQKKLYQIEQENARMKAHLEKIQRQEEEQNRSKAEQQVYEQVENEFLDFFKTNSIQATPDMVAEVATILQAALAQGEDWNVKDAYRLYERREQKRFERNLQAAISTGKIPKELAKQFRLKDVEALKKPAGRTPVQTDRPQRKQKVSVDDFFKQIEDKYK